MLVYVSADGDVERLYMLSGFSHVKFMKDYFESEIVTWKFTPLKRKGVRRPYTGVISIPFCYGELPKKRWC